MGALFQLSNTTTPRFETLAETVYCVLLVLVLILLPNGAASRFSAELVKKPAVGRRSVRDSRDIIFDKVRYSNLPGKRFLFNNVTRR